MRFERLNSVVVVSVSVLIVLTFVSGIWWVSASTYHAVLTTQEKTMQGLVDETTSALEDYIQQVESLARTIAAQPSSLAALRGDGGESSVFIRQLLKENDGYWAAFVFDDKGFVAAGSNAKGADLAGADRASRGYVKSVLGGRDLVVSKDILMSKSGNAYIFAVAASIRDESGKIVGGVGLFPFWERFTKRYIDPYRVGENGYGFMLDEKGRIIAHAMDKDLMLKDISKSGFVQTVLGEKNGKAVYEWEGRPKRMAFRTIEETGWSIAMSAYEEDLGAEAIKQRNILGIGGAVAGLVLIGALVFLLRGAVIRPIQRMLGFAERVAGGDFKAELEGAYRYELAILADKLGIMVAELKNKLGFSQGVLDGLNVPCAIVGPDYTILWANKFICDLLEKTEPPEAYVGQRSGEFFWGDASRETLSDRAIKENSALSNDIVWSGASGTERHVTVNTTPFEDMDGNKLGSISIWLDMTEIRNQQAMIEAQNERIAAAADRAEDISQHLSSAAEELAAQVEEATQGSDVQRERAASTATAMEEMNATVLEVAQNAGSAAEDAGTAKAKAQDGAGVVGQVIEAIGEVQAKAEGLRMSMEELGHQAESIGNVMNVITDIADQTNLLALNAAIEAARAGDAGRGFAVVADEVRKLAEKTMQATQEVGDAISAMQGVATSNVRATEEAAQSVSRSTELAEASGGTLTEIVGLIEVVADQVSSIATAAEQQSATSEEINSATEEINRISSETAEVMTQSSQAVQEVARMAAELTEVIEEMSAK